jgi:membrane protein implicated in regulation of membrane protease activity
VLLTWILVALLSVLAVSVMFALLVARVLGRMGREISEILEEAEEREMWATAPLAREAEVSSPGTAPESARSRVDTPARG